MRRPLGAIGLVAVLACTADSDSALGPSSTSNAVTPVTLIGAGDAHAKCTAGNQAKATAAILAKFSNALVYALGDNAGNHGLPEEFECYDLTWGKFKSRTVPVVGNHEQNIDLSAKAHFDYFNGVGVDSGPAGHRERGYYVLSYGGWRIFVGNSQQHQSDQAAWIAKDLAANPTKCAMAIWHRPLFTGSANTRPLPRVEPMWKALYNGGADVIIGGHSHQYERYARTRWDGTRDSTRGIRHFVAGTGGGIRMGFSTPPHPASQVRISQHGVLKLTLWPGRYAWEFIDVTGRTLDSGGEACHW
jgi:hypothetical protein